jgi:hypothetical protein
MNSTEDASDIRFTDDAGRVLESARVLVVPTKTDESDCLRAARVAVADLDDRSNLQVVLYDRSDETWVDTPHPTGPYTVDDLPEGHAELVERMRDLESLGVSARAWLSTLPSLTDIVTAVQELGADVVLLPDPTCDRRLFDRLTGESDVNDDVAVALDNNVRAPVTVLALDGATVRVVTVTEAGTATG